MNFCLTINQVVSAFPDMPAVEGPGGKVTYEQLFQIAGEVAALVEQCATADGTACAVASGANAHGCAAILGIMLGGMAYLPLRPEPEVSRSMEVLRVADVATIVVDHSAVEWILPLLSSADRRLNIIDISFSPIRWPEHINRHHNILRPIGSRGPIRKLRFEPEKPAYVLFTSGSTGSPKGVSLTFKNLDSYISNVSALLSQHDASRSSGMFELTFDLSVHDMFVTWTKGGTLVYPSPIEKMNPRRYLARSELSSLFIGPTVASLVSSAAPQIALPSLTSILFCGEALRGTVVEKWQAIAPNATIYNLYGPTETTIAISALSIAPKSKAPVNEIGVVSIGSIFSDHEFKVVDEAGEEVTGAERGELVLSGPQVSSGYINVESASHYWDQGRAWYNTGDIVSRGNTGLDYWGREDGQIKANGQRIEIAEIEQRLSTVFDVHGVYVVTLQGGDGRQKLAAFCVGHSDDRLTLQDVNRRLPSFCALSSISWLSSAPMSPHGKIDRKRLQDLAKNVLRETNHEL